MSALKELINVTSTLSVLIPSRLTLALVKLVSPGTDSNAPMSTSVKFHLPALPILTVQTLLAPTSALAKLVSKEPRELVRMKMNVLMADILASLQACVQIQSDRSNAPVEMDMKTVEMDAKISTSARLKLAILMLLALISLEALSAPVKMGTKAMECFA